MSKNKLIYDDKDKYDALLKISNPERVIENAIKYFNDPNIKVYLSTTKSKKYMIYRPDNGKKISFGQMGYYDFTKHLDLHRREAYLNRSYGIIGDWKKDKYSANNLSRAILWN